MRILLSGSKSMAYSFKGNLSFGFVFIPVTLHSAVRDSSLSFRLFDRKTKSRIQYKKTCVDCDGREVKNEELVKGFEYEDGKYVMLEEKDFEKIKTEKDKSITIEQFVDIDEIDPLYFDKSYYMVPTGAEKAYSLLLKAMREEKKGGLGKTVLGTKETLVLIRPKEDCIVLSTLFFYEEIKDYPDKKVSVVPSASELRLARLLIREMASGFNPKLYRDEYAERVNQMIEEKIKGKKIVSPKRGKETQIRDLMEALETSIEKYHKKIGASKRSNSPKRKPSSPRKSLS